MAEIKTRATDSDIDAFLKSVEPEKRRTDSFEIKRLFDSVVGEKARLWNNNMVGYGSYHYKSDRSTQEGDWPLTAFSPRKQNITIYIMTGANRYKEQLAKLGKFKVSSGSCLYINKLEDINQDVLKEIISASVSEMKKTYGIS
jgi:hypothetical protein